MKEGFYTYVTVGVSSKCEIWYFENDASTFFLSSEYQRRHVIVLALRAAIAHERRKGIVHVVETTAIAVAVIAASLVARVV